MKKTKQIFTENILLRSDNGTELSFRGRLYSESAYYDEETATLTRLRLFVSKEGEQVYSVISGEGAKKVRRHYKLAADGENCRISDGRQTLSLPAEMLFAAVFGLCGIDAERAEELKPAFEENLRLAMG